jgi:diguanylate cyclase
VDGRARENPKLASTRSQLGNAANQLELMAAARDLGDWLKSERMGLERELNELGAFLKTVAIRVEELRGKLRHSGYTHDDSLKSNAWMRTTIQSHIDELRGRVVEEHRIDNLKSIVSDGLGKLEVALSEHVKAEGERHRNARDHVSVTLRRLTELDNELAQLRGDLEQQHSLSLIDPLTGLYNRLGYMEGIAREFARRKRQGGPLSLAVFDLDHFKAINDRFGHATGDKVLTSMASLLRKHVRTVDLICRFGGEEFVLLMPDTNLQAAATVAEKLRATVAGSQFRFKETPVPVTMSCGLSTFRDDDSVEDVFERADRALYRAKNEGRNRCCVEESEPPG